MIDNINIRVEKVPWDFSSKGQDWSGINSKYQNISASLDKNWKNSTPQQVKWTLKVEIILSSLDIFLLKRTEINSDLSIYGNKCN